MSDADLAEQQKSGFAWEGQFQGLPGRMGGNLFQVDRLAFVDAAPARAERCRGWDQAATEGAAAITPPLLLAQSNQAAITTACLLAPKVQPLSGRTTAN